MIGFIKKCLNHHQFLPLLNQVFDDFYKAIESQVKEGHDIVGILLSSDMSGTFSTSNLVKEMILEKYPNANIGDR